MRVLTSIFVLLMGLMASSLSQAEDTRSICAALDRPDIDCTCVADRMNMLKAMAPSETVKTLLSEQYAFSVGADNNLEAAFQAHAQDEIAMLTTEAAYDRVGGRPENTSEFEDGCVITDATPVEFEMSSLSANAQLYAKEFIRVVGSNQSRNAVCIAQIMDDFLTESEMMAQYTVRTPYPENINPNDDWETVKMPARARQMGVSTERFGRLISSSSAKVDPREERDSNYCDAMTYASNISLEQNSASKAKNEQDFEDSAALPNASDFLTGDDTTKARRIMTTSCAAEGHSNAYCQCRMADFENRIVSKAARPGVVLAWAMMRGASGIPDEALLQIQLAAKKADQIEAGQLFATTYDVGESCQDAPSESTQALKGDARTRMVAICMSENDNQPLCECTTDKMREKLSADDFELVVDIREADMQGADDPLAKVAADRGLTAEEGERALETNKSLMMGMMGADLMSCMGGMPDMSQMPGVPQLPGQ